MSQILEQAFEFERDQDFILHNEDAQSLIATQTSSPPRQRTLRFLHVDLASDRTKTTDLSSDRSASRLQRNRIDPCHEWAPPEQALRSLVAFRLSPCSRTQRSSRETVPEEN